MATKTSEHSKTIFVRDVMRIGVPTCSEEMPLVEAARQLLQDGLEALIVLNENGHAVGLLGVRETVAAYARSGTAPRHAAALTVGDAMCSYIPEMPPDIPIFAAAQLMLDRHQREVYLMHRDGGFGWPAAALRLEDILQHLVSQKKEPPPDANQDAEPSPEALIVPPVKDHH